ncbi:MAG: RNA 2',3'-cyclic phosphodiesterase [Prolixibacteraceae bacterium]
MSNSIRTFIAIKIHPEEALVRTMATLRRTLAGEAIKWVEANNLHLTLKFLGDTSPEQVEQVKKLLENITGKKQDFQITLSGLGFFKSRGMPRVLFARVHDFELLELLVEEIDEQLEKAGFEREKRKFKPHLTFARIKNIKDKRGFFQVIDKLKHTGFQKNKISEVIFYKSNLTPQGPVYEPLLKSQFKN